MGAFDEQVRPRPNRFPRRHPATAPATTARRRPPVLRGWWPGSSPSPSCARIASIRSAAASRTCSQLSNTSRRDPALQRGGHATRPRVLPGCWVMPSTAATASGTAAGSATAANSKTQTPSGNSSARRAATSNARRVLPTPPTPVNVTNRCACSAACTSATSDSRPMKLVVGGRRFPGLASSARNGGKSVRRPSALGPETPRPASAGPATVAAPDPPDRRR